MAKEKGEKIRRYYELVPYYIKVTDMKLSNNPQVDNRPYRGFYIQQGKSGNDIIQQPEEGFKTVEKAREYVDWLYKTNATIQTKTKKKKSPPKK